MTIAKGLAATKYDLQKERQTDDGMQLLRESVHVMLVAGTNQGNVAAISFAVAADGTLSQIGDQPTTSIRRSNTRQILLPLNTLDEIKAIGDTNPPPQGTISGFARGEDDEVILTSDQAIGLAEAKVTQVKITENKNYNRLYSQVTKIDDNTFEIIPESTNGGNWEVVPEEETGLIFNGMVTAYEITPTGKLKITAFNHGLDNGDAVQIVDTKTYDGTYTVTKIDDNKFSLNGTKWQAGTVISAKLQTQKRRGITFDGINDYISFPPLNPDFSQGITVEAWVWYDGFTDWSRIIDFGNGAGKDNIVFANERTSKNLTFAVYREGVSQWIGAIDALETGKWMHLAATIDAGGNAKLYKNGIQIGEPAKVNLPKNLNRTKNYIGRSNWEGNGYFNGKISDIRIWNKARTQAEIQSDMNKRIGGKEAGLVAYYPLNSFQREDSATKVLDLVNHNHGTVTEAYLVSDQTLLVGYDALVSSEYSTISKDKSAMMRRFLAVPVPQLGVNLLPDKRIEQLELKWIGNGQFAPTLLGYIEGAPPIPSENLTLKDNYNNATSVELAISEDVTFNWTRSQDSGLGATTEFFKGVEADISQVLIGYSSRVAKIRSGVKGNLDFSYQFQNESSITANSSLRMTDKLQLIGTQEPNANFSHLGKRFIPKNVGYALVVSALADVFITRLQRTGKMIGYQVLPVDNIPPDVNTITFLINPAYTMSGSLDGLTGSSATSNRFFKHVPAMRSHFGSLYPASYYRLQEAYDLKQQIEQQDKNRESYFAQFNSHLLNEASLDREVNKGDAPEEIFINRSEDKPDDNLTDKQKEAANKDKQTKLEQETKVTQERQSEAVKRKQSEISTKIQDEEKRNHAIARFANWQKKMEDIQIRASKRNIVNTYVWDADGGLRTEAQSFANTAEHSIGGSFILNAALGYDGQKAGTLVSVELTAQATINLTQTMTKTEIRSEGIQLNVDLSGVENRGVTDYNDYPILPGEKVNRYRFMSFYLEGSTNNFNDFFSYVVDPEWLASNSEEARALRQARGKANKAWRVLHRVTYVERPALMGFGRDVRRLASNDISENQKLLNKIADLEKSNQQLEAKLNEILNMLKK